MTTLTHTGTGPARIPTPKDPDSVIDYRFDWTDWLTGDTIEISTWLVPAGLTLVNQTQTAATTTVWLAGGVLYAAYVVTNRIVTVGGRTEDRSMIITILEK